MKKIIFGGIAIVAIAGAIAISVTMKATDYGLSDLSLSNVEVLADKQKSEYGYYNPILDCCDTGGNSLCYRTGFEC